LQPLCGEQYYRSGSGKFNMHNGKGRSCGSPLLPSRPTARRASLKRTLPHILDFCHGLGASLCQSNTIGDVALLVIVATDARRMAERIAGTAKQIMRLLG